MTGGRRKEKGERRKQKGGIAAAIGPLGRQPHLHLLSTSHRRDMDKPKVLVTNADIPAEILESMSRTCEVIVCPDVTQPIRKSILKRISGVSALFWCTKERLDDEILDAAGPNLKVVSTMSAGYDHIDVNAVKSRGIKLGNTPYVLNGAVAEIAIALALMAGRRLHEGRVKIEKGDWDTTSPMWMLGQGLQGSTVGIVGFGRIGHAIAKRLLAFEISRLLYYGNSEKAEAQALGAEFVTFEELLKESDFVIIACSLNKQTKHMFNANSFSKMKKNGILVNISRGDIVDQVALKKALESGQIYAAGLDVMVPEPLPKSDPLLKLKNCILMPHLGSATLKTRLAMAELAAKNILAGLEDKDLPAPV